MWALAQLFKDKGAALAISFSFATQLLFCSFLLWLKLARSVYFSHFASSSSVCFAPQYECINSNNNNHLFAEFRVSDGPRMCISYCTDVQRMMSISESKHKQLRISCRRNVVCFLSDFCGNYGNTHFTLAYTNIWDWSWYYVKCSRRTGDKWKETSMLCVTLNTICSLIKF